MRYEAECFGSEKGEGLMNLEANIQEEIIGLAEKHKIKKVILFGSRARGDNREKSDIMQKLFGAL